MNSSSKRIITGPVQGCAFIFLCLLMIWIGVFLFRTTFLTPLSGWRAARSWQERPCTVVESRVLRSTGRKGVSFRPVITYTYEVGGQEYRSSRYSFRDEFQSADPEDSSVIVDRYPPGTRIGCWVDPDNPNEAVIDREFGGVLLLGAMMGLFAPAGAFALLVGLRQLLPRGRGEVGARRRRRR